MKIRVLHIFTELRLQHHLLLYGHHAQPMLLTTALHFLYVPWCHPQSTGYLHVTFSQVPLDYAHPEVGSATLAIARLKATKQPRLGTIFTNPGKLFSLLTPASSSLWSAGGPGEGGVLFLIERAGVLISTITQGQYDIVSE
jgi:hypothetical protein